MLKIGITGTSGFIGKHLYNSIGLLPGEFERIDFKRAYFDDEELLQSFVSNCDVIVHLAALNRHNDQEVIYQLNLMLVKKLVNALNKVHSKAHVLFSSSTQEENDNLYGKSKKEGRILFLEWAKNSGGRFTGFVIPNVFGPFGHPNYNSVIATFCHKLSHQETPVVEVDSELKLIYVGELVDNILNEIRRNISGELIVINPTYRSKVSNILALLQKFKTQYQDQGIIPDLNNIFEINLFNTFRCFMSVADYFPVKFTQHKDPRGAFVEIIRLNNGGQVSFSTTLPGVTRGNHFHTRKIERFAVIKGKALIQLRQIGTDKVLDFYLDGDSPGYVDMPIWYTHNIKNIGQEELYTIFWINEFYDQNNPDTYFENV